MSLVIWIALLVAFGAAASACWVPASHFSETNARAHLQMLADEIGSRYAGTPANARARAYLIDQLTLYGFDVRVQAADAVRAEAGVTARVANIVAVKAGARREGVGLIAHYDSRHDTPGGADDGLGDGGGLEAARVLAARPSPNWSLFVILTDGEEAGLMGARAITTDREVQERLAVYLNLEAIGSDTPGVLFETGPGNEWLVERWARSAPAPAGGSYSTEVYERLPNDTDFTILKQLGVPGLNFAAIGDSYPYHTARDTADRVTPYVVRQMGQNIVGVVEGLERADILTRTPIPARYYDVAGRTAIAYGTTTGRVLAVLAVALAIVAEVRMLRVLIREPGLLRLVATAFWWIVVAAAMTAAMAAQPWALRLAREVYHPWYAHPWRLFSLIAIAGGAAGWALVRLGGRLPERVRGYGQPLGIWAVTLPVWTGLGISAEIKAASAAYLWTIPLAIAALGLVALPLARPVGVRATSIVVLVFTGVLWLRMADLLPFLVAVFGRLSIVTPSAVYAAVIALITLMVAPPLVAALSGLAGGLLPWRLGTALWLLALATAAGLAYEAPAYTRERPLRRAVRYVHDGATGVAFWEVGSNEPGLDLHPAAPPGWVPVTDRPTRERPRPIDAGRVPLPFPHDTRSAAAG